MAEIMMQGPSRVLPESDATPESFHDAHVHGLAWRRDRFSFFLNLQYILEWIAPSDASSGYRFSICEARLRFHDVDELVISMDWSAAALDAQIDVMRVLNSRTTPTGRVQRQYEIEFSEPEGRILLWSTGYQLSLLHDPVTSEVTNIPLPEDAG